MNKMDDKELIEKLKTQLANLKKKNVEQRIEIVDLTEKKDLLSSEISRVRDQYILINELLANVNELMKLAIINERKKI